MMNGNKTEYNNTVDGLGMHGMGNTVMMNVQKISIGVSEPQRSQKGDFNRVFYNIVTRNVGGETTEQYITQRTYKDITNLYQHLDAKYLMHGVIGNPNIFFFNH